MIAVKGNVIGKAEGPKVAEAREEAATHALRYLVQAFGQA